MLLKKSSGIAACHGVDAVGDENAFIHSATLLHLVTVDKDDAVATVERNPLALAQQPTGGRIPLAVLIVGAVVGQHHGQSHQAHQRSKHAGTDVVDMDHVGTVKEDVQHAQQGVPHRFKALDAGRGQVNVLDVGERQ